MENIARVDSQSIIAQGGNMDSLVAALGGIDKTAWVQIPLLIFSNFAVASSFLGVTLGLFDYLADLFKFDNSPFGRLKAAVVTFLPSIICGLTYLNGFIYTIGFTGLAAKVFAVIVPKMLAVKARERFPQAKYRVWGGKWIVYLIFSFGGINMVSFVLSNLNVLLIYP